ncbi:glycoside hydrolase family 2 TIM barrel-domain containing protein [Pseudarthrobacter sp. NPDC058329]|uniref:glycoside hydrolase family 2 TIM barrel-domain containing protein n=1 Tax=Pseudarthrobacter sp. NPDC058329 TaxID=3346448 RepID=UPI0036DA5032
MTRTSFNDGWLVQPKVTMFAGLGAPSAPPEAVTVPHDALIGLERSAEEPQGVHSGYFPGGAFEYLKTFEVPEEFRNKRVTLEFQGVYRDAMVYVNGSFAAQRPYGYSTFYVPLDPFLDYGKQNTVRVDSRVHEDSRWYTGAGIYRDVRLIVSGLTHLATDGVRVTTPDVDSGRAVVEVAASVHNEGLRTETFTVTNRVFDAEGNVVAEGTSPLTVRCGATAIARHRLYVREPKLWGVENPYLYTALTTLHNGDGEVEEQDTRFGIRTLQLDPEQGLRINGQPIKLRGACIHHDNGILGSAAIGRAEERRVQLLKAAGFNAIRSSHNPISQAMLEACDHYGMLVMDETFDMWTEAKSPFDYSLAFPEWWERDVEAMVAKDFNHPSVVMYSIGNEIPETGNGIGSGLGRDIAEKIRSLDSGRFIINAVNGMVSIMPEFVEMMKQQESERANQDVNSAMKEMGAFLGELNASQLVTAKTAESLSVVDIAGLNYGDSRYVMDRELFPNRIHLGTETFPTNIDARWKLVQENPHVIGDFVWTGWDYLGESGVGRTDYPDENYVPTGISGAYPWLTAWVGDIDITGQRRPASYYRETVFGLRHEPYIAVQRPQYYGLTEAAGPWSWTDSISSWSWDVAPGSPVKVEVYSDADEVELLLNNRSVGRTSVGPSHSYRAIFELDYEPGELTAVSYVGREEQARFTLCSAAGPVVLRVEPDKTQLRADHSDLSFVSISIRDQSGNLASNIETAVTVKVEGPGSVQALGSARPDSTEGFASETHTTFDGKLLAVVRPDGAGEITVRVSASGYEPVAVSLEASQVAPSYGAYSLLPVG